MATYGYLCPTPKAYCKGAATTLSASLDKKGIRKHGSPKEAQKCYGRYLTEILCCTKISAREFKHPNGGPIEVLTKAARFGARLRTGKGGDTGQNKSRGMPSRVHGGVIIAG